MKWENKGHEFEYLKEIFTWHKPVYIYGGGGIGEEVYERMKFVDCVKGFIDNRKKEGPDQVKVYTSLEFLKKGEKDCIVILAAGPGNMGLFKYQLLANGYEEGKNVFGYSEWIQFYMPLYFMYAWDKMYFKVLSFLCTTKCNLKCKKCLNFTTYNRHKEHYDLPCLKQEIDRFFEIVDYIDMLHVCGGEPLLYPELPELLEYIAVRYRDRIYDLLITTNGTMVPKDELCRVLSEYHINVQIDDYRDNVPVTRETYNKVKEKFEQYHINVLPVKVEAWLDILKDGEEQFAQTDDAEELAMQFSACNPPYKSLHNGKIYLCNFSDFAEEADMVGEHENDVFVLEDYSADRRMEFLEFMMNYSDRGYCELCKKCKGFSTINGVQCMVAEQEN